MRLDRGHVTPATIRPDVHERFAAVVERAIARADRQHAEHLARLRLRAPRDGRAASRQTNDGLAGRRRRRRQ
jgi:hypothetical protein